MRKRYSREEILAMIEGTGGKRVGWRITEDSKNPLVWCWFTVARIANSEAGFVAEERECRPEEVRLLSDLILHGDVVCRMVENGRSKAGFRYAHASIE